MSGRIAPVGGLTYFDANMGRLVTEGPDVCDYKSRLREIDPTLNAYYDTEQQEWIVTCWNDKRNQEELVLTHPDLAKAYEMTLAARNDRPGALTAEQLASKLEKEQDAEHEKTAVKFRNIAGDAAERLTHALEKDGFFDHENIYGPKMKPALSARAASIRGER
jgi:hypothetical protein